MSDKKESARISVLDVRMGISVAICYLTATVLNHFGIKFQYGNYSLEIIQMMTACIGCLLCCQDTLPASRKAGVNRLIITAIGGVVAVAVIALDVLIGNKWILIIFIGLGVVATLFLCKLSGVPYVTCRIGALTFIIVTSTLGGTARIWHGIFRLVSTLYGVLIVLLVTWISEKIRPSRKDA